MKISTKGRYALRFLADLAVNQKDGYVSLSDVAVRQGISKKYLEQIVSLLHGTDFLDSSRGTRGGYRLAKPPEKYTVKQILLATEGSLAPVSCLDCDGSVCDRAQMCPTLPVWRGLETAVSDYLDNVTLQDIAFKR